MATAIQSKLFSSDEIPSVPTSAKSISRDEMNLAEFPLTVLSTRANPKIKTLEFKDTVRRRNGELINREWIITGTDKFGLPTSSDDEVLIGLLKLTADQNFNSRKVNFTRYELLKALRWTTEGRSYQRLQKALDRLTGVRIKASNAFFDNATKSHSTVNFGILDAYEINHSREKNEANEAKSFFTWSEVLFNSFQVGYIKKLDLSFYINLQSAVSKRLFRYLDKHFWYKSSVKINVFTLAHEKLGVSRNYKYCSSLRQQIDPAIQELIENGFLSSFEYAGKGKSSQVILYAASKNGGRKNEGSESPKVEVLPESASENEHPPGLKEKIIQALDMRGLKQAQAQSMVANTDESTLTRIVSIIHYFDELVSKNSALVSKSPVGFLYKAVATPHDFCLPDDMKQQREQTKQIAKEIAKEKKEKTEAREKAQSLKVQRLKDHYQEHKEQEVARFSTTLSQEQLTCVQTEVSKALDKLRGVLSDERIAQAVELGVFDKIATQAGVPSFEAWVQQQKVISKKVNE